jgi:hypothetical protein
MDVHKIGLPKLPKGHRWIIRNQFGYYLLTIEKKGLFGWHKKARCSVGAMTSEYTTAGKIKRAATYCLQDYEIQMYEGVIE